MTDQLDDLTPRTAREVRIAREAARLAWEAAGLNQNKAGEFAAERYPLPTRTQRREVQDEYGIWWRVRTPEERATYDADIPLEWSLDRHHWYVHTTDTEARLHLWADLLATPTEEVPDDQ